MKKWTALFLAILCIVTLAACGGSSGLLVEEDGYTYLVLPVSRIKVYVSPSTAPYAPDIDPAQLRAAEERLLARVAEYTEEPRVELTLQEGKLCLCVSLIEPIDPPAVTEDGREEGCNIDHRHLFFCEPIE